MSDSLVPTGGHGVECVSPLVNGPVGNPCIHLLRTGSTSSSGWEWPETPPPSAEEGIVSLFVPDRARTSLFLMPELLKGVCFTHFMKI